MTTSWNRFDLYTLRQRQNLQTWLTDALATECPIGRAIGWRHPSLTVFAAGVPAKTFKRNVKAQVLKATKELKICGYLIGDPFNQDLKLLLGIPKQRRVVRGLAHFYPINAIF